jgi:hypothetical protein
MCTAISRTTLIRAAAKGPAEAAGWFPVTSATVAYDHATHTGAEHALLLDFANYEDGTDRRLGLEMDLASARALAEQLHGAIEDAERSGLRG